MLKRTHLAFVFSLGCIPAVQADHPSSYMPVDIKEDFLTIMQRMSGDKAAINKRQQDLLSQRYDLPPCPLENRYKKAFGLNCPRT